MVTFDYTNTVRGITKIISHNQNSSIQQTNILLEYLYIFVLGLKKPEVLNSEPPKMHNFSAFFWL